MVLDSSDLNGCEKNVPAKDIRKKIGKCTLFFLNFCKDEKISLQHLGMWKSKNLSASKNKEDNSYLICTKEILD